MVYGLCLVHSLYMFIWFMFGSLSIYIYILLYFRNIVSAETEKLKHGSGLPSHYQREIEKSDMFGSLELIPDLG